MNMLRSTSLFLSLSIIHITTAQLAPERPATTGEHMLVVNAEWSAMGPAILTEAHIVSFTSDTERIADHLHRVADRLGARPTQDLAWQTAERRRLLLDTLNAYADRCRFPVNHSVPGRSPVFIDDAGNACAVGQLMISSGHAVLAERIRTTMNLAYIHDITLPEVAIWASEHGFTADELAWIQPTYDHMRFVQPGLVASFVMANGDRIEVQGPKSADAAQKLRLIRINDQGTKVLATLPLLSGVQAMEFNGHVYVAGMPPAKGTSAEVYQWNGSTLQAHDPFPGRMVIGSLNMENGTLHVVGYELGNAQTQERYLTEDGEWKVPVPALEEVPRIGTQPE